MQMGQVEKPKPKPAVKKEEKPLGILPHEASILWMKS